MNASRLKRLSRVCVIMATLLSLPGYGLAAAGLVRDCPVRAPSGDAGTAATSMIMTGMDMTGMDMAGMDMAGSGAEGMATPHDCCAGAAGHSAVGQHSAHPSTPAQHSPGQSGACAACQAGHTCKSSQGVPLIHAPVLTLSPVQPAVMTRSAPCESLHSPDGLLRPPDLT